jgi:hypothetical protein
MVCISRTIPDAALHSLIPSGKWNTFAVLAGSAARLHKEVLPLLQATLQASSDAGLLVNPGEALVCIPSSNP